MAEFAVVDEVDAGLPLAGDDVRHGRAQLARYSLARTEELTRLLGGEVEAQELTAEAYKDVTETEAEAGRLCH